MKASLLVWQDQLLSLPFVLSLSSSFPSLSLSLSVLSASVCMCVCVCIQCPSILSPVCVMKYTFAGNWKRLWLFFECYYWPEWETSAGSQMSVCCLLLPVTFCSSKGQILRWAKIFSCSHNWIWCQLAILCCLHSRCFPLFLLTKVADFSPHCTVPSTIVPWPRCLRNNSSSCRAAMIFFHSENLQVYHLGAQMLAANEYDTDEPHQLKRSTQHRFERFPTPLIGRLKPTAYRVFLRNLVKMTYLNHVSQTWCSFVFLKENVQAKWIHFYIPSSFQSNATQTWKAAQREWAERRTIAWGPWDCETAVSVLKVNYGNDRFWN